MKIVQINTVYQSSSTGRNTWELHEYMKERGHKSYIASVDAPSAKEWAIPIGNSFDRKVHALLSRLTGRQGCFSKAATRRLINRLTGIEPDVVILGVLHSNCINLRMLLSYLAKSDIAVIAVLHDCYYFTGKCMHYTIQNCYRWRESCGNCPQLKEGNASWFFDRTRELLSMKKKLFGAIRHLAFVGVSDWITREIKSSEIGRNAAICRRIYNWVDFNKFYKREVDKKDLLPQTETKFVILSVSDKWTDDVGKGLDNIIKLAALLSSDMLIVLVGKMESKRKLPDNIICTGHIAGTDRLCDFYNMADVYLNFSVQETFGKVSAEALSCGVPVVCQRSTANPELAAEGCGYVLEPGDMGGIRSALQKIKDNGKEYYSDQCTRYAHKFFDKNKNINEYLKLMEEITEERRIRHERSGSK